MRREVHEIDGWRVKRSGGKVVDDERDQCEIHRCKTGARGKVSEPGADDDREGKYERGQLWRETGLRGFRI